jgi:SAM-dependent methyltransferase
MYIYQIGRDTLFRELKKHADALRGVVLDAGSGDTNRYSAAFSSVEKWVRLDIDPKYKPNILGSVTEIPVADNSYDGVFCSQVLGDVLHPQEAVSEFWRTLKPGGVLVVTEGFMNELHGEPRDYFRYTHFGLAELCEHAGFVVERKILTGGLASVIAQARTLYWTRRLRLRERPYLARVMNKVFILRAVLAVWRDQKFAESPQKFGLNAVVIARKPV